MSHQNVEELERVYEAFNAGDVEPLLAFLDAEFVLSSRDELPGGGLFGLEAAVKRLRALREVFDEIRCEPQEFIEAGDRILVVVRQIARGRASGAKVEESMAHVWLIQNERAKELRVYSQRNQALQAVGLRE
jgi:ketosteroid isomerase-like protein